MTKTDTWYRQYLRDPLKIMTAMRYFRDPAGPTKIAMQILHGRLCDPVEEADLRVGEGLRSYQVVKSVMDWVEVRGSSWMQPALKALVSSKELVRIRGKYRRP